MELFFVTFAEPRWLWGLLALPAIVALQQLWHWSARRQQARIGATSLRHTRSRLDGVAILRQVFLWTGLGLCVLALARPQWGEVEREQQARGANIVVLLDCSRSMLAEDLYPNRLELARRKVLDFLHLTPDHRIALVPFARRPLVRSPLTGDPIALERLLDDCTPELFPRQGTAIGAAVERGIEVLQEQGDRGRAILIFSDGSGGDRERIESATRQAALADIPVFGVYLGDPDREVSLLVDGEEVVMASDRSTLDWLASETGAICVNVIPHKNVDIKAIQEHIDRTVPALPWAEERQLVSSERYYLALWPALVLLLAASFLPTGRRLRPMWEAA